MHESIKVTEFIVKEDEGFRLRVKSWECLSPKGLYTVEFINECLRDGEVDFSSTYNFFMTKDEMKRLSQELLSVE